MKLLAKWLLSASALLAVAYLYGGVQISGFGTALIAGVSSVAASMEETLETNAALIMGGNIELSRADRAATADELAKAEAEKRANQERIAARIIDAMDILKLKSPEVAAAFKASRS